MGASSNTDL